jgi:hypothetical protein
MTKVSIKPVLIILLKSDLLTDFEITQLLSHYPPSFLGGLFIDHADIQLHFFG